MRRKSGTATRSSAASASHGSRLRREGDMAGLLPGDGIPTAAL
jgi:hypothetical protein